MSISQLARSIKASPTLKLNEMAAKLREKGEPVIHLGGGEPKSKPPLDAVLNCSAQLNTGEVRYAPADGLLALKKAAVNGQMEAKGFKQAVMRGAEFDPLFHSCEGVQVAQHKLHELGISGAIDWFKNGDGIP